MIDRILIIIKSLSYISAGMEWIRDMLVEAMPGYIIISVSTNKRDEALRAELKGYNAHCAANPRLVYFIYVTQFCPYISQATRLRADNYRLILHKTGGHIIEADTSRDVFRRQLRVFRRNIGEPCRCDACDDSTEFAHLCQCLCVICHKCMLDNMKGGIYRCLYCQHKARAFTTRGGVIHRR